jgi:hypothetical protein
MSRKQIIERVYRYGEKDSPDKGLDRNITSKENNEELCET